MHCSSEFQVFAKKFALFVQKDEFTQVFLKEKKNNEMDIAEN